MNNTRRKLKDLYEVAGFTKQAHSDFMKHARKEEQASNLVLNAVMEVRKMHPVMGLKKIYHLLMPDWIGRDKFIDIGMFYGLGAKVEKNFRRTTFSTKSRLFINLLSNLPIIDINPRRDKMLKEELKSEARRLEFLNIERPEDIRFNERSNVERVNGRLKDEFGGRMVRVR